LPYFFESEELSQAIKTEIESYFKNKIATAGNVHPNYQQLWDVTGRVTLAGGKRLRPKLFLFGLSAYTDMDVMSSRNHINASIAWEILHSALLIHDDIMDHASTRHGQDNVTGEYLKIYAENSKLDQEELLDFANCAALLSGDLLINAARQIIEEATLSSEQKSALANELNSAIEDAACGQILDSQAPTLSFDEVTPDLVIRMKTSGYTTIGPIVSGAAMAGADEEEIEKLRKVGELMGRIFQLTDDLLCSFGDEAITGKSTVSDIRDGEKTLLLIETHKRAEAADRLRLERLDGINLPDTDEINYIKQLMIDTGAKQFIEQEIDDDFDRLTNIVTSLKMSEDHKSDLLTFTSRLKIRKF